MRRLIKKSIHDVPNRDSAFIYINDKFYEDVTHATCLYQFLTDEGKDIDMYSFQTRPSISTFEELSEEYGTVILGHLVKAEDGVFIIYGYIKGKYCEYSDIPKNELKTIQEHYGMETYDDLAVDELVKNNSNTEENITKFEDKMDEVSEDIQAKTEQLLLDNDFSKNCDYFINSNNNVLVQRVGSNEYLVCKF